MGLFASYVRQLNNLFVRRRNKYASSPDGTLPKKVFKMLSESVKQSGNHLVRAHSRSLFEVQRLNDRGSFRVVDLEERTCTCSFYKEYGVPCRHVCAAVLSLNEEPKQFVAPERCRDALLATDVGFMRPVDTSSLTNDGTKPPVGTKKRGRPKEKRYLSAAEKKGKRAMTCGRCGIQGHNARTCKKQTK